MPDPMTMLMNQLLQENPQLGNLLQQVKTSQNPETMLNQMFQNNPQWNRVQQMLGGKSQDEQQQVILNLARNMGIQL